MELANRSIMVMGRTPYTKLDATSAAPAWDSTATYAAGVKVTYKGRLYEAIVAPQASDVPGGSAAWADVTLVSLICAAVQQIAPDFTAKAYAQYELCTYNGVVYRCKSAYTATAQSTKPSSDTIHWEAKKASELFLGNAGAQRLNGTLEIMGDTPIKIVGGKIIVDPDSVLKSEITIPYKNGVDGVFALLSDLAPNFSTSATYAINNLCVYNGTLYRCTTAITTAEAWTAAHWTEATVEDVLAAIRSALDAKAPLASPAFTGTPTAPTPTAGDNSTKVATTAFVKTAVDGISVTPLSGNTYDFSTNADVYKAVADIARALGATVTNAPTDPVSTPSND